MCGGGRQDLQTRCKFKICKQKARLVCTKINSLQASAPLCLSFVCEEGVCEQGACGQWFCYAGSCIALCGRVRAGLDVVEWYVAESSCCYPLWPVRSSILQGNVHRVVQTLCAVYGPLAHGPLASALCRGVLPLALSSGMDAVSLAVRLVCGPGCA